MAAKPGMLQRLIHGRILCAAVFPTLVETWNWLVDTVDQFKGDLDANPATGFISVDRTIPDTPIVRLDVMRVRAELGEDNGHDRRPFAIDDGNFINCYYLRGSVLDEYEPDPTSETIENFITADPPLLWIAFVRSYSGSGQLLESIRGYENLDAMKTASASETDSVMPLYKLTTTGDVELDLRGLPASQEFDAL